MNAVLQAIAPTKDDFVKIARKIGFELYEYKESRSINLFHAVLVPPMTDENRRDGVRPVVLLSAQFSNNEWQFWSSSNIDGMEILGEIPPTRRLLYRYIIAVPA